MENFFSFGKMIWGLFDEKLSAIQRTLDTHQSEIFIATIAQKGAPVDQKTASAKKFLDSRSEFS